MLPSSGFSVAHCAATVECHAPDIEHDTPLCHSIKTQGSPVVVLSIYKEHHIGSQNYPLKCICSDLTKQSLPPHKANTLLQMFHGSMQ